MKLLIAEDESHIREGLKKLIPWQDFGIDTVTTAKDGQEAVELCLQMHPDILITDIRMPHMDGIELAERVKKHFPNIKIIFLSSHTDKEYLKAAIRIQAASYIEKPLNRNDLLAVLQDITAAHRSAASAPISPRLALLQIITQGSAADDAKNMFITLFGQLQIPCRVFIIHLKDTDDLFSSACCAQIESLLQQYFSSGTVTFRNTEFCGLIWGDKVEDCAYFYEHFALFSQKLTRELLTDTPFFIACGSCVSAFDEVYHSFQSAQKVSSQLFFRGYSNGTGFPSAQKALSSAIVDYPTLLETHIRNNAKADALALMDQFYKTVLNNGNSYDVKTIKTICLNLYLKINELSKEFGVCMENDATDLPTWNDIASAETFDGIHTMLLTQLRCYFDRFFLNHCNPFVSNIFLYIGQHFHDSTLCIERIADYVGLTSNYVCHLFKKEMGITITAYITQVRMDNAKRLLRNKKLTLSEIAANVGYNDVNYFIRVFKKHTNSTPTEYRNQHAVR